MLSTILYYITQYIWEVYRRINGYPVEKQITTNVVLIPVLQEPIDYLLDSYTGIYTGIYSIYLY